LFNPGYQKNKIVMAAYLTPSHPESFEDFALQKRIARGFARA